MARGRSKCIHSSSGKVCGHIREGGLYWEWPLREGPLYMYKPGQFDNLKVKVAEPVVQIGGHEGLQPLMLVNAVIHLPPQHGTLVSKNRKTPSGIETANSTLHCQIRHVHILVPAVMVS